jgi:hypothetical protein
MPSHRGRSTYATSVKKIVLGLLSPLTRHLALLGSLVYPLLDKGLFLFWITP